MSISGSTEIIHRKLDSKTKILSLKEYDDFDLSTLPEWNYDGSSTNQASTDDSEMILKPVKVYDDPFAGDYLVLCEVYNHRWYTT